MGVAHLYSVRAISLLDYLSPVIDIAGLALEFPGSISPSIFSCDASASQSIVGKATPPFISSRGHVDTDELHETVRIVIDKARLRRRVGRVRQVPVRIIGQGCGGGSSDGFGGRDAGILVQIVAGVSRCGTHEAILHRGAIAHGII